MAEHVSHGTGNYAGAGEQAREKGLVIVTAGKSGSGKTTLINNFLGLKGDKKLKAGHGADAGTVDKKVIETVVNGVPVTVIDTPGFEQTQEHDAIATKAISSEHPSLVLYCLRFDPGSRVGDTDVRIIRKITQGFESKSDIWKKTVLVLTFANYRDNDEDDEPHPKDVVEEYVRNFQIKLRDAGVVVSVASILSTGFDPNNKFEGVLAVPAGRAPTKSISACEDWEIRLIEAVFRQADPKDISKIAKVTGLEKWMKNVLGVAMTGAGVVGTPVLFGAGCVGGFYAAGITGGILGILVGSIIGAVADGERGSAVGAEVGNELGVTIAGGAGSVAGGYMGGHLGMKLCRYGLDMIVKEKSQELEVD